MKHAKRMLPALMLAACTAACSPLTQATGGPTGPEPITPTERYAIEVARQPDDVALAIHAQGLSAAQRGALADFASRWREAEAGEVTVRTPGEGGDARRMGEAAATYLLGLGVPGQLIHLVAYDGGAGAPVVAGFSTYQAHGPDCAHTWDNLTSTGTNQASRHFGCTVTANFAAQIANPRDLLAPAQMTPADNTRRATVFGKYRKGEVTSSAKDEQASGAVSKAVN